MPYRNSTSAASAQRTSVWCNDDDFGRNELAIKDVKPRTERDCSQVDCDVSSPRQTGRDMIVSCKAPT